jgi:O-methyltransferase involved in polyketide biosynthesis
MQAEKVEFTKVQETMLITLYARALQSRSKMPILHDPWAEEAISHIDHDFAKFKVDRSDSITFEVRAKKFDLWTAQFLANHPCATVLYLGCGLDARVYRVDPSACVSWYDVDYPEVIDLRRRLYPERSGHRMIGSTLADLSWLEDVPNDEPALIVAEGVTMYLTEDIIKQLFNRLVDHFPSGEIVFDAHSRRVVRWMARTGATLRETGASFLWGIDKPQEIYELEPRLEFVMEFKTSDLPDYSRMPFSTRTLVWIMDVIPAFRGLHRPLLYRFPGNSRVA